MGAIIEITERSHRPTIHDVARHAKVSSTTVSHVLNQTRPVADDTRSRVLLAVEALGYEADATARGLRVRRRNVVGLLITNPHNRGFASFMDGIDEVLTPAGFSVLVSTTRGEPEREVASLRTMYEQRVDGLILASWTGGSESYHQTLVESGLPMVQLNRVASTLEIDSLGLDYFASGRLIANHLVDLGHRAFGIVGLSPESGDHPFIAGWLSALQRVGLGAQSLEWLSSVSREEIGYRLTRRLLDRPQRPTALVTVNPPLALGALLACQDLGLRIPANLALATLGDAGWTRIAAPPVTAIADALPEWGRLAARFLLQRIRQEYTGPPRRDLFQPQLITRESTVPSPSAPMSNQVLAHPVRMGE
jgi:LacI family transcriptional regulator